METWLPIINTVLTAGLGGLLALLAQWVVPRTRKTRETAEAAERKASAAKLDVETIKLYREELNQMQADNGKLWDEIANLNQRDRLRARQIAELREHMDDLYTSIGLEEETVQKRIFGRLRTKRPNGGK
jgi:predicted  nucleic acid-binding Zn-ribbon protein